MNKMIMTGYWKNSQCSKMTQYGLRPPAGRSRTQRLPQGWEATAEWNRASQPLTATPAKPRSCAWRSHLNSLVMASSGPWESASYGLRAKLSLIDDLSLDLSLETAFGIKDKFLSPSS